MDDVNFFWGVNLGESGLIFYGGGAAVIVRATGGSHTGLAGGLYAGEQSLACAPPVVGSLMKSEINMPIKHPNSETHRRRYHGYDYSRGAAVFVTIVTEPRQPLFGRVCKAQMVLSEFGHKITEALQHQRTVGVALHEWVVMPDHVHFMVHLKAGQPEPLRALGHFVGGFKSYTTRLYWQQSLACASAVVLSSKLWQEGYHDWLCISRRFIDNCIAYIGYNPLKYELLHNGTGALKICEPIDSELLPIGEYWKGVGNMALLRSENKLLSVRISRKVETAIAIDAVVSRLMRGVEKGFIPISGFVSSGEKAFHDALLAHRSARFIQVEVEAIPVEYRPASSLLPALSSGRMLLLGRPEATDLFDRAACIALNESILTMAHRSIEGIGCYAQWVNQSLVFEKI